MTCGARTWLGAALALAACDGNDEARDAAVSDTHVGTEVAGPDGATLDSADAESDQNQLRNGVTATIAHIVDGDTFDVVIGRAEPRTYTVRMRGLSAPECFKDAIETEWGWRYACESDDELHGLAAYQALYGMLHGQTVWLTCDTAPGDWCPTDVYGRFLAYAEFGGLDAATEMARGGHGFSYTDYPASRRAEICQAEYDAKAAGVGLWAEGDLDFVLAHMHGSTAAWYREAHDARCDAAIAERRAQ